MTTMTSNTPAQHIEVLRSMLGGYNHDPEHAELYQALAGVIADAERYRWLCDKCNHVVVGWHIQFSTQDRDIDQAIDAAMNGANNNYIPDSPHNAATDNTRDGGEE